MNYILVMHYWIFQNQRLFKQYPAVALKNKKVRTCFQCNNVVDESGTLAVFAQIGSSVSLASGARIVDAYSLCDGNNGEQSDAPKAYTQCPMLEGLPGFDQLETWVSLERDQWPASWAGMHDPVCPLLRALYGHPLAGNFSSPLNILTCSLYPNESL